MTPTNWGVLGFNVVSFRALHITPKRIRFTCTFHLGFGLPTGISSARSFLFTRKLEVTVSGGSTFARVKLKEIDGMAPQDVERAV